MLFPRAEMFFLKTGAKLLPFFEAAKYFNQKAIKFYKLPNTVYKILFHSTIRLQFATLSLQNTDVIFKKNARALAYLNFFY